MSTPEDLTALLQALEDAQMPLGVYIEYNDDIHKPEQRKSFYMNSHNIAAALLNAMDADPSKGFERVSNADKNEAIMAVIKRLQGIEENKLREENQMHRRDARAHHAQFQKAHALELMLIFACARLEGQNFDFTHFGTWPELKWIRQWRDSIPYGLGAQWHCSENYQTIWHDIKKFIEQDQSQTGVFYRSIYGRSLSLYGIDTYVPQEKDE